MTAVSQNDPSAAALATTNERHEFIAIVLYESSSTSADYTVLYDESIIVVWARNRDEARRCVEERGTEEATSYTNEFGETITWSLRRIVDISPVLEAQGSDVRTLYSRHFRDIASYESFEPLLRGTVEADK